MEKFFKLFSCNKIVRGKSMGAIYLLNRARIERVPLDVCDLISELEVYSINFIKKRYREDIVNQWISYLIKNEIGHLTQEPNRFNNSPNEYNTPSLIQRAQIEFSLNSSYNISSLVKKLDLLLCKHIEVRFVGKANYDMLNSFFNMFKTTCIRSISVYIESYHSSNIKKDMLLLYSNNPKISYIYIFNAILNISWGNIHLIKKNIDVFLDKPWNLDHLLINFLFFTESLKYNTFYHKKIAINKDGVIKNDLSLPHNFDTVDTCDIEELINDPQFTFFWNINADSIESLKDSELRYAIYPARELIKQGDHFFLKE
jgi:hypothetical protein